MHARLFTAMQPRDQGEALWKNDFGLIYPKCRGKKWSTRMTCSWETHTPSPSLGGSMCTMAFGSKTVRSVFLLAATGRSPARYSVAGHNHPGLRTRRWSTGPRGAGSRAGGWPCQCGNAYRSDNYPPRGLGPVGRQRLSPSWGMAPTQASTHEWRRRHRAPP
jgi:hypothetical protein